MEKQFNKSKGVLLGLASVFAALPLVSHAAPITLTADRAASTENRGDFTGQLSYSVSSSTATTLQVQVTNTSNPANGGYLTAFIFNNPGNRITGATLTATDLDFSVIGGPSFNNSINGAPYGNFDIGASIFGSSPASGGPSGFPGPGPFPGRGGFPGRGNPSGPTGGNSEAFQGGGDPSEGIAVGSSETFTFNLTGTSLNTLSEASFRSELSVPRDPDDQCCEFFVARFQGFLDGGSDKVPASMPEPTSLMLFGSGLAGLAGMAWRKGKSMQK